MLAPPGSSSPTVEAMVQRMLPDEERAELDELELTRFVKEAQKRAFEPDTNMEHVPYDEDQLQQEWDTRLRLDYEGRRREVEGSFFGGSEASSRSGVSPRSPGRTKSRKIFPETSMEEYTGASQELGTGNAVGLKAKKTTRLEGEDPPYWPKELSYAMGGDKFGQDKSSDRFLSIWTHASFSHSPFCT